MSIAPGVAYMALSLSINTVLTLLIIGRLLWLRRKISKILGADYKGTYISVVAVLIESASLYTIIAIMAVVACGISSPMQYILLPVLGQLQVSMTSAFSILRSTHHAFWQAIPSLLITSRLASGQALSESTYASVVQSRPVSPNTPLPTGKRFRDTLSFSYVNSDCRNGHRSRRESKPMSFAVPYIPRTQASLELHIDTTYTNTSLTSPSPQSCDTLGPLVMHAEPNMFADHQDQLYPEIKSPEPILKPIYRTFYGTDYSLC